MKMEKMGIAIGEENFLEIRKNRAYYVDKSLLIKNIIESPSKVIVFTRPRRFGKTLNISMLAYYFDILQKEAAWAFEDLEINKNNPKFEAFQNQYPVIKMTLKDVESSNFEDALGKFKYFMSTEYRRHNYLLDSEALDGEQKRVRSLLEKAFGIPPCPLRKAGSSSN